MHNYDGTIKKLREDNEELHRDTRIIESIDDVKEVALSCERKIKVYLLSPIAITTFKQLCEGQKLMQLATVIIITKSLFL